MVESQNWTSEFTFAYKNLKDLYSFLEWELSPSLEKVSERYPIFIPRSLAKKIKKEGADGILAKEFLPQELELEEDLKGLFDPIGDKEYLKAPQLIHRYKTRALFTPTSICPVHCRYCFRKNELSSTDQLFQRDFNQTKNYLKEHTEINEIIFTGGDPLTLSNERIAFYLNAFSQVKSIRDIRFHTRYPVILPERLDDEFINLILEFVNKFRTVSLAIHVNHSLEFDSLSRKNILKLSGTGVQLLSQTVLLRGVNDSSEALIELFQNLIELRVRPYYLHHPDHVKGGMHFYLPLKTGRQIYQKLRSELPGWAIPHYVIDIPGGHGKVSAFNPETTDYSGRFISKEGQLIEVSEPDMFH